MSKPLNPPSDKKYVFVSFITRNGRRIYAKDYGLRAFCILVDA